MEEEKICEVEDCEFPASECLIPDHPQYCGEHLEQWYMAICKRINEEQMFYDGYPDPVGV